MSIANLFSPNNYNLFCETLTGNIIPSSGNLTLTGNLVVDGTTTLDGLTTAHNFTVAPSSTANFTGSTVILNASTVELNLQQLSNVIITSPIANQILEYNGTNWINANNASTSSGTYVGTLTGVTNIGSPNIFLNAYWFQLGSIVTVYVTFTYTPTSINTLSVMDLTLPVAPASNFSFNEQLIGSCSQIDSSGTTFTPVAVIAEESEKLARFQLSPVSHTGVVLVNGSFNYSI